MRESQALFYLFRATVTDVTPDGEEPVPRGPGRRLPNRLHTIWTLAPGETLAASSGADGQSSYHNHTRINRGR